MKTRIDKLIQASPNPQKAVLRFERLFEDATLRPQLENLPEALLRDFIAIISVSNFLFHYVCRHPDIVSLLGRRNTLSFEKFEDEIQSVEALRMYKYSELFKLTWMDISRAYDYPVVLAGLSRLAETIIRHTIKLALDKKSFATVQKGLSIFALGKLGANELNYSSDIDLIFVSANHDDLHMDIHELQHILANSIRSFTRLLEDKTPDGFLYRVDLKLRPWGRSGPLFMSIDETENYYEASSDAWERLAWLRAKVIAGSEQLGEDLLQRMQPFIFMRSLSTEDLERFVQIKNDMGRARKRTGHWNVKVGEGGIRDLEFFIQILQIVNASKHEALQTTNTIETLSGLKSVGLISDIEQQEILYSYLFLRRLENRLQMIDETQTHELPEHNEIRNIIARSLGIPGKSDNEVLDNFENELFVNRTIAKSYFERVLPAT